MPVNIPVLLRMQKVSSYTEVAAKNGNSLCKLERGSFLWHKWETLQGAPSENIRKSTLPFLLD